MRKPRKWHFYARVSTTHQEDGTTLDDLEKAIRRRSEIEGYPVETEDRLHDQGSGADPDQPDSPPSEQ